MIVLKHEDLLAAIKRRLGENVVSLFRFGVHYCLEARNGALNVEENQRAFSVSPGVIEVNEKRGQGETQD